MMRRVMVLAAVLALALVAGCGGDDDEASEGTDSTATSEQSSPGETSPGPPDEMEITQQVNPPDCPPLEPAATALVGPGSTVDGGNVVCQFFGQTSSSGAGTSWRLSVTGDGVIYPELDFESAVNSGFSSSEGMVEAEAPEGWTVAATRTSEEPDPDFPEATSEQELYFGGPGVAGLVKCRLELTSRGEPGAAPPAAPAIDQDAFLTFCNTAKDQMVVDV